MRTLILFLATLTASAQIVITPTGGTAGVPPSVGVGASQAFTASGGTPPYTWSLVSGSAGSLAGATYTAPSTFNPAQIMGGCPVTPSDSVFNTPVANGSTDLLPVDTRTTPGTGGLGMQAWVLTQGQNSATVLNSFAELQVTSSTPSWSIIQNEGGMDGTYYIPNFPFYTQEGGILGSDFVTFSDHHGTAVKTDDCTFEEWYQLHNVSAPPSGCRPGCNVQSAIKYSDNYVLPDAIGSTDAAGLYLMPLALRYSEINTCASTGRPIQHALRFTLNNGTWVYNGYYWPATANAVSSSGGMPYGERMRLTSTWYLAHVSSYNAAGQCILTALRNYGMIMADGGGTGQIIAMADVFADTSTAQAIYDIFASNIPIFGASTAFEAIDESSLIDTSQCPNCSGLSPSLAGGVSSHVNPANGFVTPSLYASIHVVDSTPGTPLTADLPIILKPVTMTEASDGTGYVFQSGAAATDIPVTVQGAANQAVTCTISPATGTISSGTGKCTYTPPSGVTSPVKTTLTIVPAADTNQSWIVPLTTMASTIREALNAPFWTTPVTDPVGNVWYNDAGAGVRFDGFSNGQCGSSGWPANTQLFQNFGYSTGQPDVFYRFTVAPGTYMISWLFGQCQGGGATFTRGQWGGSIDFGGAIGGTSGTNFTGVTNTPTSRADGASGFLGYTGNAYDQCDLFSPACENKTPATFTQNVTVTSAGLNNLYFAMRGVNTGISNSLNSFSIAPLGPLPSGQTIPSGVITSGVILHDNTRQ